MNNSDKILKDNSKNNLIMMNHLVKSVLIKKSNQLTFIKTKKYFKKYFLED